MHNLDFRSVIASLLIIVVSCQELPWYLRGQPVPQRGSTSPPSSEVESSVPPLAASRNRLLVNAAKTFVGTDYRLGGTDRGGIDCSGLVYAAARQAGIPVHRTTTRRMMVDYKESNIIQGALPLFSHNGGKSVAHVGIWDDPEKKTMVHASSSKGVIVSTVNKYYWLPKLVTTKELPL